MNRNLRPTKSAQKIKHDQINFLLEDVEKKSEELEEFKKATELKDRQLSDIKKILQSAKKKLRHCCERKHRIKKIRRKF